MSLLFNTLFYYYCLIFSAPTKPPKNFSCQAVSCSCIYCEWGDIPLDALNGELLEYRIKYRIYDSRRSFSSDLSSTWLNFTTRDTERFATINGLKASSRYELTIHGVTVFGEGLGDWYQVKIDDDGKYCYFFSTAEVPGVSRMLNWMYGYTLLVSEISYIYARCSCGILSTLCVS